MAAEKKNSGVAVAVACLAVMFGMAAAASHTVGDSRGWTIPTSSSFYSDWASKQTFKVGDVLVFNFQTGQHTVAEVSKSGYDSCSFSSPISRHTNGPANVNISSAGSHYYVCTVDGHCSSGQKLAITATSLSSSSPASSPAPSTSAASPSPSGTTSESPMSAASSSASPAPSPTTTSIPTTPTTASPSTGMNPAGGPSGGAEAPPSSASVAGISGLVFPAVLMTVGAFLY